MYVYMYNIRIYVYMYIYMIAYMLAQRKGSPDKKGGCKVWSRKKKQIVKEKKWMQGVEWQDRLASMPCE